MGYLNDIVARHFCAEEDATGESIVVVSDAKGGADKSLPQQVAGDSGPIDFHRGHARSRINGEDRPERSLREVGDIRPKHFRQRESPKMGRIMGIFSPRRDQTVDHGRKCSKGAQVKKDEEEDAALASAEQQGKRKKKDISKIKCFNCGELGHYATQCPKKKDNGEQCYLGAGAEAGSGSGSGSGSDHFQKLPVWEKIPERFFKNIYIFYIF